MTAFRPVPATGFMPLAAVFDLDHTLIAGDATIGWTEYLYERGVVTDPVFREINERMKASYHAGTLDIAAWLREAVPAYSGLDEAERNALVSDFIEEKIRPIAYPQGFETIRAAKAAGMLTLIISASNAFFVKPIAERVFGVDVALGTELVVRNGRITPELSGTPTFREGKVVRLCAALEHRGLRPAETVFYTDSRNDLPLALASGDCVAVKPRPRAARGRSRERMAGERMEAFETPLRLFRPPPFCDNWVALIRRRANIRGIGPIRSERRTNLGDSSRKGAEHFGYIASYGRSALQEALRIRQNEQTESQRTALP